MRSSNSSGGSKPTRRLNPSALRLLVAAALTGSVMLVGGCRTQTAQAPQSSPPPPVAQVPKIGIVDLEAAVRGHPRWPELQAINTSLQRLEGDIAQAINLPPAMPQPTITAAGVKQVLDREAAVLKGQIDEELNTLRAQSHRRLDAIVKELQSKQRRKLDEASKELTSAADAALEAKRKELQEKLRTGELAILEEYSYPILNLRLRAEVAGLRSEDEARQILRQIQLLQSEREARVADLRDTLGEEFDAFRAAKEAEINDRLKALQETLNKELQERIAAKEKELATELATAAAERQARFQRQMAERQRTLVRTAESQLRSQQRAIVSGMGERVQRLQAQRVALLEQRQRLEDAIQADIRIEVAALAAQQGLDTVLTRLVVNIMALDVTSGLVRRLKQR